MFNAVVFASIDCNAGHIAHGSSRVVVVGENIIGISCMSSGSGGGSGSTTCVRLLSLATEPTSERDYVAATHFIYVAFTTVNEIGRGDKKCAFIGVLKGCLFWGCERDQSLDYGITGFVDCWEAGAREW